MEQDNRPVKIDFPKKMTVTSPEIDAIKETSNRISNWLHHDLKNIIEPLTVVKFIPDLLRDLSKTIVNQFSNLLIGQVESDVINRQANIKLLNKKIDSTQKHIEQKEDYLNKTIERVNDRYTNMAEQLNVEHETFLHKLDSHAYEIIEHIYPKQVQERFSYDSLPGIEFLTEHAKVTVEERNLCLNQGLKKSMAEITSFMEDRLQLNSKLQEFEDGDLDEGIYELPWCFVEMENKATGETKLECWFEPELATMQKNPAFDELRTEMEYQAERAVITDETKNQLLNDLNSFINDKLVESEMKRFLTDMQLN